ncbi:MAG: hypothetical protein ACRDQA_29415 [Nocardioidaceae bacterium]
MRYKLTFITGFAIGYVLGAKAGRERYETMMRTSRRLTENPSVQEAAGVLQAQAGDLAGRARRKASDTLGDRVPQRLRKRTGSHGPSYAQTSTADGQPAP